MKNLSRYGERTSKIASEAFDDMLRAMKDQDFLLRKYDQCTSFKEVVLVRV